MKTDVGATIAVIALVLVVMALVGAGLYALFGTPSSQDGKRRKEQVIHGLHVGGGIVLGMILMGAVVGCSQIAFGIVELERLSRIGALFIALASLVLIFSMIRYWAKYFAGWVSWRPQGIS
jgi:hypothetical protein